MRQAESCAGHLDHVLALRVQTTLGMHRAIDDLVHFEMTVGLKRLPSYFYRLASRREPVREWLKTLDPADRQIIGEDIKDVELAWPIGLPLMRSFGDGLWEVRSALPGGRAARVIFVVERQCMVLLHGFVKKTQATPKAALALARKRRRDLA